MLAMSLLTRLLNCARYFDKVSYWFWLLRILLYLWDTNLCQMKFVGTRILRRCINALLYTPLGLYFHAGYLCSCVWHIPFLWFVFTLIFWDLYRRLVSNSLCLLMLDCLKFRGFSIFTCYVTNLCPFGIQLFHLFSAFIVF